MRRPSAGWVVLCLMLLCGATWADFSIVDGGGFEFYIQSDVTFETTSSASGAISEASFTSVSGLNDGFDGYNSAWINGTCYNNNGPAALSVNGRTAVFAVQTIGNLQVYRKLYVPGNDEYCRWLTVITNVGSGTEAVTFEVQNNLGSDSNTAIESTSSGDATATVADTWVVTTDNGASEDPPLGHILQGAGAAVALDTVTFTNGDDNPYWKYQFDIAAGQTAIIMNFVTGQTSIADAEAKAASIASLGSHATSGLSASEKRNIVNFAVPAGSGCTAMPAGAVAADMGGLWGDALVVAFAVASLTLAGRRGTRSRVKA